MAQCCGHHTGARLQEEHELQLTLVAPCISPCSGFIAVHVVASLLERGYKVRGTVRSKEKGDWLVSKYPGFTYV